MKCPSYQYHRQTECSIFLFSRHFVNAQILIKLTNYVAYLKHQGMIIWLSYISYVLFSVLHLTEKQQCLFFYHKEIQACNGHLRFKVGCISIIDNQGTLFSLTLFLFCRNSLHKCAASFLLREPISNDETYQKRGRRHVCIR